MRGWRLGAPLLGIAWRLGLGLAAVAAVLVGAEVLATRTTRDALEAVRAMQSEHEPLANSADAVLEKLVAYDQAVGAYVQARSGTDVDGITLAGDALEDAVAAYFVANRPQTPVNPATVALRAQLTRHIETARQLASRATQRWQWIDARGAALNRVYQLIASAGGSGVAIDGTQVYARRSLAELQSAINAVRGNLDKAAVMARREEDFRSLLDLNAAELQVSPGRAWLALLRQDFAESVRLRLEIARYDSASGPEWHNLLEESAALIAAVDVLYGAQPCICRPIHRDDDPICQYRPPGLDGAS